MLGRVLGLGCRGLWGGGGGGGRGVSFRGIVVLKILWRFLGVGD